MQVSAEIKIAMSTLTNGVYILGVHTPEKDNLMTAAWLSQVSGMPPTLAVAVNSNHLTAQMIPQAKGFAVSVLSTEQKQLALCNGRVSGRERDKLVDTVTVSSPVGHPLVAQAVAHLECQLTETLTVSDHTLFIGQVIWSEASEGQPLLYREKEFFG